MSKVLGEATTTCNEGKGRIVKEREVTRVLKRVNKEI